MKQLKITTTVTLILTLICLSVFAHVGEDHAKKKTTNTEVQIVSKQEIPKTNHYKESSKSKHVHGKMKQSKKKRADFNDFSSLHPLVVHFPIVLLLIAVLVQIAGFFVFKEQLSWVTLTLVLIGLIGAYVSGGYVHPHTAGLSDTAAWILEQHEKYADYTLWGALVATVFKTISHFVFKRAIWLELVTTMCLVGAAYFVTEAGHYGAQLIHIEGVGAKGEYIETETHNHRH